MSSSSSSLKVLTYNVNFGLVRFKKDNTVRRNSAAGNVISAITESECDIVALQETNAAWEELMKDVYGLYPHQVWFHRGAAGGQALLSKFPIEHSEMCNTRAQIQESWFEQMYCILSYHKTKESQEQEQEIHQKAEDEKGGDEKVGEPLRIHLVSVHLRPPKGWMWWTSGFRMEELRYVFDSLPELKKAYSNTSQGSRRSSEDSPRLPLIICGGWRPLHLALLLRLLLRLFPSPSFLLPHFSSSLLI
jgi:hypothetical protein